MFYACWNGTNWTNIMFDNSNSASTSITMNNTGGLWISYIDTTDVNHYTLKCAHQNGTGWVNETLDTAKNVSEQISHTSIAIDKLNYVHIAYNKPGSGVMYATNKPVVIEFTFVLLPAFTLLALFIIVIRRRK